MYKLLKTASTPPSLHPTKFTKILFITAAPLDLYCRVHSKKNLINPSWLRAAEHDRTAKVSLLCVPCCTFRLVQSNHNPSTARTRYLKAIRVLVAATYAAAATPPPPPPQSPQQQSSVRMLPMF